MQLNTELGLIIKNGDLLVFLVVYFLKVTNNAHNVIDSLKVMSWRVKDDERIAWSVITHHTR